MDAETALGYQPELDEDGEDALGYYDDGVKRTLTDEQIEMFRHSEIQQLMREEKLEQPIEDDVEANSPEHDEKIAARARSPLSEASSIEEELLHLARPEPSRRNPTTTGRKPSPSSGSDISLSAGRTQNRPAQEIAYDERNKRKWEDYIEDNDPTEGSLTHRRIARQLDDHRNESVDLDY